MIWLSRLQCPQNIIRWGRFFGDGNGWRWVDRRRRFTVTGWGVPVSWIGRLIGCGVRSNRTFCDDCAHLREY